MAPRRRRPDGIAILVTGSRGSGKSGWTRQAVQRESRLLVWDTMHEWSRDRVVTPVRTLQDLHQVVVQDLMHPGPFRYGYVGPTTTKTFPTFCRLAIVWMKAAPGALVVEELADVTHPGKAPEGWGECVREGRHYGGRLYALTQRPAESDKTIAGNVDIIHAGRQSFPRDRKTIAEYLDVPVADVTQLQNLHWLERDLRTHALRRGTLSFGKARRRSQR